VNTEFRRFSEAPISPTTEHSKLLICRLAAMDSANIRKSSLLPHVGAPARLTSGGCSECIGRAVRPRGWAFGWSPLPCRQLRLWKLPRKALSSSS
jgi:hypothetical protein